MVTTIPLGDASLSEVIARVVYRLIEIDYKKHKERYDNPKDGIYQLSRELRQYSSTTLHTAFAAASVAVNGRKGGLEAWRDEIILRSRYAAAARRAGRPWAKCPTPLLVTRGSPEEAIDILSAPLQPKPGRSKRGRKSNGY